tara:strand:+ start:243 stop:428 length:186 start_codon:yes stop_codon:yes gene_type:complete
MIDHEKIKEVADRHIQRLEFHKQANLKLSKIYAKSCVPKHIKHATEDHQERMRLREEDPFK